MKVVPLQCMAYPGFITLIAFTPNTRSMMRGLKVSTVFRVSHPDGRCNSKPVNNTKLKAGETKFYSLEILFDC